MPKSKIRFDVRPAVPSDHEAVSRLLAASYPKLMTDSYDPATLAKALPLMVEANPKLLASGTFHVALDNEKIVGCGGWTHERPGDGLVQPQLGHLRHFATHPDFAGQGIGRLIFSACRDQAVADGVVTLECYASLNAERFYAALGFAPQRRIDVRMASDIDFPSILMVADLKTC